MRITRADLKRLAGRGRAEAKRELEKLLSDLDLASIPPWHRGKAKEELLADLMGQVEEIEQDEERVKKRRQGLPDGASAGSPTPLE